MQLYSSVFKDESKLDINYAPPRLPHREKQLTWLNQFFRFALDNPGKMTQRVLVTGKIGTGKTVLTQHFGQGIMKEAKNRGINLHYVHVNCRELKGSLFFILQYVMLKFAPNYPKRGYSAQELLRSLMDMLDDKKSYVIITLDELDALIQTDGPDALYSLTRVQEDHSRTVQRISLICVLRETALLSRLDSSTRSTLQHNIVEFDDYSKSQLLDILSDRVAAAFRDNAVYSETVDFVAESAASLGGDARYAIELLWRAGKYADFDGSRTVQPEHVRRASESVHAVVQKDSIFQLSQHQKMFLLGVARWFKQSDAAYISMGEAENAYAIVCEEYDVKKRGHTQLWKYVQELSALDVIKAELSGAGQRGKTMLISLTNVSAVELEKELVKTLGA